MAYRVYGMSVSGNCHKVRQVLALTEQSCEWIEVDLFKGETRTAEFLSMNPNGKVPVLELPDGRCLPESNAILCFLAEGTAYLPEDRFARAQVMQWLFFEQYSHEPYIAVARFICKFLAEDSPRRVELPRLIERGDQALAVMEKHLSSNEFLVGDSPTIADIALHAYSHCAADGGFDLEKFPSVRRWLSRLRESGVNAMPAGKAVTP